MIHPDDVRWACLVAERDGSAGRPFTPIPDTPAAHALAEELLALPLDAFLLRVRQIRERSGDAR